MSKEQVICAFSGSDEAATDELAVDIKIWLPWKVGVEIKGCTVTKRSNGRQVTKNAIQLICVVTIK